MHRPSCRYEWFSQPPQPQVVVTTTTAHGSLAPNGLWCPIPPRYSDPIRQSRRLPLLSQNHWLYRGSLPATLLWAANETFPALGSCSFLTCRHPYAERRNEGPQSPLASCGLPAQNMESAPLFPLTSAPVRALLTTLQCSLHATARKVASPPGLIRPRALLWPPRTFNIRACPRPVARTPSRVSLHSPPGGELWPDFHRLEHYRYRLHVPSQSSNEDERLRYTRIR